MISNRSWRIGLVVIFLLALVVRWTATGLFVGFASLPDASANPDQLDYEATAHQLSLGKGFAVDGEASYFRSPGTSLALAPVYLAAGRSWVAGRLWFGLLSAATAVALAGVARQTFDRRTGLVAGLALAFDPAHFTYAMHFVSEVPYALAIVLAVGLAIAAFRGAAGTSHPGHPGHPGHRALVLGLLAGAAAGAATLARTQAAVALPIAVGLWGLAVSLGRLRGANRGARTLERQVAVLLAITAGFAVVVGPWMLRNHRLFDTFELAGISGPTFFGAHNELTFTDPAFCGTWLSNRQLFGETRPRLGDRARSEHGWAEGWSAVRRHAGAVPRLEVCKLQQLVAVRLETPNRLSRAAFALAWIVVAPLGAVGLFVACRRDRQATAIAAVPLLVLLAATLIFYGSIRLRHSTEPLLVLFAAGGVTALARRRPLISPVPHIPLTPPS